MSKFVVWKSYRWAESGFDPITVLDRTDKTITVSNGANTWRMLVRIDDNGDEWVRDSSEPKYAQDMFVCNSNRVLNTGDYGYRLVVKDEDGRTRTFGETGWDDIDMVERHMNYVAERQSRSGTILAKELVLNGTPIKTY